MSGIAIGQPSTDSIPARRRQGPAGLGTRQLSVGLGQLVPAPTFDCVVGVDHPRAGRGALIRRRDSCWQVSGPANTERKGFPRAKTAHESAIISGRTAGRRTPGQNERADQACGDFDFLLKKRQSPRPYPQPRGKALNRIDCSPKKGRRPRDPGVWRFA